MILNFIVSIICGGIIGASTVLYVVAVTKGVEIKKRLKVVVWVGVPAGMIMSVLAQFIGRHII